MDIEKSNLLINGVFRVKPSRHIYDDCLLDLLTERYNIIMSDDDCNSELLIVINTAIEIIQKYINIISK